MSAHVPTAKTSHRRKGGNCGCGRRDFISHHQAAAEHRIQTECRGPQDHRTGFDSRVGSSVGRNRQSQSGKGDGRSCTEQARETLRFKNVPQGREERDDKSADYKTKKKLKHLEIRPLAVSTGAVRGQFTVLDLHNCYGELHV